MTSSPRSRTISLVGAIFCFGTLLIFVQLYFGSTVGQLGFSTTGETQIVDTIFLFGSAFLIVFGLVFLRDYYRT